MMKMKQYTKIGLVCLGLGVGSSAYAVSIDGFPQLIDLAKNKVQTLHKLWHLGADTLKGIEHLNEGMLDVRNFTLGMQNTLGTTGQFHYSEDMLTQLFKGQSVASDFHSSGFSHVRPDLSAHYKSLEGARHSEFQAARKDVEHTFYVPGDFRGNYEQRTAAHKKAKIKRNWAYREAAISGIALSTARKKALPEMQESVKDTLKKSYTTTNLREDVAANTQMVALLAQTMLQNQELLAAQLELASYQAGEWHGADNQSVARYRYSLEKQKNK